MRRLNQFAISAVFALALAGCGESAPERGSDERQAAGEVLGGSISDAMLPLDQLRSQSPTLREQPAPQAAGAGNGEGEEAADGAPAGDGASAEPRAAPQRGGEGASPAPAQAAEPPAEAGQ